MLPSAGKYVVISKSAFIEQSNKVSKVFWFLEVRIRCLIINNETELGSARCGISVYGSSRQRTIEAGPPVSNSDDPNPATLENDVFRNRFVTPIRQRECPLLRPRGIM